MIRNVKNTIALLLNTTLTPLPCYSCGRLGELLCDNCIYDIISECMSVCVVCQRPVRDFTVCCASMPADAAFVVGRYEEALRRLVHQTKFSSYRHGAVLQARLLAGCLPRATIPMVVVPVPTSVQRVRVRGFDHTHAIAKEMANLLQAQLDTSCVRRTGNTLQHGAGRTERFDQAENSYHVDNALDESVLYVIVDDVYTTGATVGVIARKMREKGAKHIWLAITTRHTLDK